MTFQTQSTVNALQWKHFCLAVSAGSYDACWRQCCKSTFCNFDPRDVNMLLNHFCPPSRGKTTRITPAVAVMVWQGWASFVMTIVFSGLESKATRSNCLTHGAQRLPASTRNCAKIRMSSTKRNSSTALQQSFEHPYIPVTHSVLRRAWPIQGS